MSAQAAIDGAYVLRQRRPARAIQPVESTPTRKCAYSEGSRHTPKNKKLSQRHATGLVESSSTRENANF